MANLYDSIRKTFSKPNLNQFVSRASDKYNPFDADFIKRDAEKRRQQQQAYQNRPASQIKPSQFIGPAIGDTFRQAGKAGNDLVVNPIKDVGAGLSIIPEFSGRVFYGLGEEIANRGIKNRQIGDSMFNRISQPYLAEKRLGGIQAKSANVKDILADPNSRRIIGKAAEAPTWAYAGGKTLLAKPIENVGKRILARTAAVVPEALLQSGVDTFIEGDVKNLPRNAAQNIAGMAIFSNALGGYGDFVKSGKQVGLSTKNTPPIEPVKGGVDKLSILKKEYDDLRPKIAGGKGTDAQYNRYREVKDLIKKAENPPRVMPDSNTIEHLNPTGGLLVDYNPKSRMDMSLGKNITTLDKTSGKSADDIITIYRGAPKNQKAINAGDFITTNKELAKSYTGDGNILEMKVRRGDILDDVTEPLGEEYIYRPSLSQPTKGANIDLKPPKELAPRKGGSVGVKVAGDTTPKFLKEGIKYEEPARVLTPDEINRISGRSMLADENKQFKNLFGEWLGKRKSADIEATKIASKYTDIKASEGFDVVRALQGKADAPASAKGQVPRLRQAFDDARKTVMDLDDRIDIGYIDNYVTQIWKESPQQIINKANKMGLSQNLKFANERVIADYDTGIKLGLSPKFKNPAEILKEYLSQGYKLKANLDMADNLYKQGLAVPAQVAKNSPGFEFIKVSGLPNGGIFVPKKTASYFRNAFGSNEAVGKLGKTLEVGAKISRTGQELTLSGGVPGTPINFFGIGAVLQKEVLSGKPVVGLKNMAKASFGDKYAIKYFSKHTDTLKDFAEAGFKVETPYDVSKMIKGNSLQKFADAFKNKNLGELKGVFGEGFHKAIDDPTFKRYIPMVMTENYEKQVAHLVKGGMDEKQAKNIALKTIDSFYNPSKFVEDALSSKTGKDFVGALFFAPKYRKSLIGWYGNLAKDLTKNAASKSARRNQIIFVGMLSSIAASDYANYQINGKHLWENPKGKEDKILVPFGEKTIGIPVLPSLATLPRMAAKGTARLLEGDIAGVGKEAKNVLSMPLKTGGDVLANEDYFGNEIYSEFDNAGQKIGKSALYAAKQFTHPYVRGGIDLATSDKPKYQIASEMAELPLRYYNTKSIKDAPIWAQNDNQKKIGEIQAAIKSGKISQEQGQKQIQKLSGGQIGKSQLLTTTAKGSVVYSDSAGQVKFADSEQEANLSIEKDKLKNSKENFKDLGDLVLRKSPKGDVYDQDKDVYNNSLYFAQLNSYKKSGDLDKWMSTAQKKAETLQILISDPNTDQLDRITYENQLNTLLADAAKYKSYGGFKKGRKGGSSSKTAKISVKTTSPKSPSIKQPKNIASVALKGGKSERKTVKLQTRKGTGNRDLYG